jgi:hypothetical protein
MISPAPKSALLPYKKSSKKIKEDSNSPSINDLLERNSKKNDLEGKYLVELKTRRENSFSDVYQMKNDI